MSEIITVRGAAPADADAISKVILAALHETNAQDYPPEVITSLAAEFGPERIRQMMAEREMLVAIREAEVVGTASLQGKSVRTAPRLHGSGIGTMLIARLEDRARERSVDRLWVRSSITAVGFYRRLGYVPVRDEVQGEERTVIMEKVLRQEPPW